jgi:hypothetical protein
LSVQIDALETTLSWPLRLSLNIEQLETVLPYFSLNDFVALNGSLAMQSIVNLLCVHAQLPFQLGGLESNVLFIDGSNSFRLYDISSVAQRYELDPKQVLERIYISRAFTAYQLVDLIFEQLENAIKKFETKLVVLTNPAQLFQDKDVPKSEAKEIFLQLTKYLADFAKNHQIILLTTNRPHYWSKNSKFFKEVLCSRANIVATTKKIYKRPHFVLQKHPTFKLSKAEFPTDKTTLNDFIQKQPNPQKIREINIPI